MRTGGLTSSAPGEVSDIILDLTAQIVAGNTLAAKMTPYGPFARRYFAPFVGGVYLGNNVRSHHGDEIQVSAAIGPNALGSIYFEDCGDWASIPDGAHIPDGGALALEALTAKRILFDWENSYNLTGTHGDDDDQISNIVVTGAVRNQNVGTHPLTTRGRLYYTITTTLVVNTSYPDIPADDADGGIGGTSATSVTFSFFATPKTFTVVGNTAGFYVGQHVRVFVTSDPSQYFYGAITVVAGADITVSAPLFHPGSGTHTDWTIVTAEHYEHAVRWYANGLLVAEGITLLDAAVSLACAAVNGSGLSVVCDLDYTTGIVGATAFVDIRWPASYQLHYSTGALTFPRTPELTVTDDGTDDYARLTPVLAAGTYNCDVLQVDDEGNVQGSAYPTALVKTIFAPPAASTITTITSAVHGGGIRITVNWTNGETGCTTMLYYGDLDSPVNAFAAGTPAPLGPSALNATSALIDLASVPAPYDFTTDFTDLVADFDAAVTTVLADFTIGEGTFDPAGYLTTIQALIDTYGGVLGEDFEDQSAVIEGAATSLSLAVDNVSGLGLTATEWKVQVGPYLCVFLSALGTVFENDPVRYYLAGYPFTVPGDTISIYQQSLPLTRPATMRLFIRATKGGIEEHHDTQRKIEFDTVTGQVIPARPNKPNIESWQVGSGQQLTVHASVLEDDAAVPANGVNFYWVEDGSPFDFTTPNATGALPAAFANYHAVDLNDGLYNGAWFKFCVRSYNTANGTLSAEPTGEPGAPGSDIKLVYIGQDVGAVREFDAAVQGGMGV